MLETLTSYIPIGLIVVAVLYTAFVFLQGQWDKLKSSFQTERPPLDPETTLTAEASGHATRFALHEALDHLFALEDWFDDGPEVTTAERCLDYLKTRLVTDGCPTCDVSFFDVAVIENYFEDISTRLDELALSKRAKITVEAPQRALNVVDAALSEISRAAAIEVDDKLQDAVDRLYAEVKKFDGVCDNEHCNPVLYADTIDQIENFLKVIQYKPKIAPPAPEQDEELEPVLDQVLDEVLEGE